MCFTTLNKCCESKWYVANRLSINTSKSNTMLIGTRQRLSDTDMVLDVSINNSNLEQVQSVRYRY